MMGRYAKASTIIGPNYYLGYLRRTEARERVSRRLLPGGSCTLLALADIATHALMSDAHARACPEKGELK